MKSKAVIFDFDGVIVQSEFVWPVLENEYFRTISPVWKPEDHPRIVGLSIPDSYLLLTQEFGVSVSNADYINWYNHAAEEVYRRAPVTENLLSLLDALKKLGRRIAISSSAPRAYLMPALERHRLIAYFEQIVSADDLDGAPSKPDPAIYLLAAERLGISPRECIAIEDATHGIVAAKGAGMRCIAVQSPVNASQDFSGADAVTEIGGGFDVEEVISLIS